jgi:branched-chain amino acid transport system ATP-binding protein
LARGVALVPEGRRVFADLSVEDNLTVGGHLQNLGELEANRDNVYTTFPRLAERRSQLAGSLSGGEQQMLAIGRAVMASPTVLLVDELSLGLMPKMVDECYRVIDALKDQGLLIMLVEQSTQRALDVADQVVVMESGRSSWQGSGLEARQNPSIVGAYLGTIEEPEGAQE